MAPTLLVFWLIFYILVDMYDASIEIVAGYHYNCVFEPGQRGMKCWGGNYAGELGYGDTNNRGDEDGEMGANLPLVDLGPDFIINTTSLLTNSCAVSQEHAVKCWGDGYYYQTGYSTTDILGDDAGEMGANLPFVEFRSDFLPLKVAAGLYHTCVLSTDSLLVCFGLNDSGQCGAGIGGGNIIGPPSNIADVEMGSNFTPIDISAFYYHVCAISQQQTIKCFGYNYYGQLGYGDTTARGQTPQSMGEGLAVVNLGSNFTPKALSVGAGRTCALSTAKTVKCFGRNDYGQCGQVMPGGTTDAIGDEANEMGDNLHIIKFPVGFVPMQMALGLDHTCILSESAQVVCFGRNDYGYLGLGHTDSTFAMGYNFTPVDLGTEFVPRKLVAGSSHMCAISTVDTIKCWGGNGSGQLGLGHANNMGDEPNEMGDNLPIVNVGSLTASPTKAPSATPTTATTTDPTANPTASTNTLTTKTTTTADPTTADPTTTAPTTANPTTATPTTTNPTTADPTTAPPTTAAPTTGTPTTAGPTSTTATTTIASTTTKSATTADPTTATPTTTALTIANPTTSNPSSSSLTDIYSQCNAFILRITTSLTAPQSMYKNVQMLSLIINSTKLAIFDEINVVSYMYDVSRFAVGGLWNAFTVYSVSEHDFDDGVDFSIEYCSYSGNFTDYIAYKMKRDFLYGNEIGYHLQWLLRTHEPLNIADAVVTITSVQGAQSVDGVSQSSPISYKRAFEILLACFIAFVVLQCIAAIVFALRLWVRKNRAPAPVANANEADGVTDDQHHDDNNAVHPVVSVVEMQARAPMEQENDDALVSIVNNTNLQHGELQMDGEGAGQDADIDIVNEINQTPFE